MSGLTMSVLFTLGWIPVFCFRTEIWREALPLYSLGERVFVVLAPLLISGHVAWACVLVSLRYRIAPCHAAASIGLFALGMITWMWTRAVISPLRMRRSPLDPPLRFRRDGPFRFVRNPLYFACTLLIAAPTIAAGEPALFASFTVCVLVLAVRCVQDERRLHLQLGAIYNEYCTNVKRLIPFVW